MKLTVSPPLTWSNLLDEHGHRIASDLLEHDAQTIAHRVNCFEELRDALHNMVASAIPGMNWTDEIGQMLLNNARAALERAKT